MRILFSRKGVMYTGLFLLSYLMFLIAQMPLSVVMAHISLPRGLVISGITGTPWQGQAQSVRWQGYAVQNVRWQFRWSTLLMGKPSVILAINDPELVQGDVTVGYRSHISVTDVHLKGQADKLAAYVGQPLPVSVSGVVKLNIDDLEFTPTTCLSLNGQAHWNAGQVESPLGVFPVGVPVFTLSCEEQKFVIKARQDSDAVSSQSTFQLTANGHYQLQSTLTAGKQFPEGLSALLKMGAQDLGNGVYKVSESGKI